MTQIVFVMFTLLLYAFGLFVYSRSGNENIVNTLYLYNSLALDSVISNFMVSSILIIILIISFISLYLIYKDKEKVVIAIE